MTDKTEKFLKIISIALPTAAILILAVVVGLFLSSAFRIYDTVKDTEPEDTRTKVTLQGVEIPVPDNVIVDSTPSARIFLDGITDWNSIDKEWFFEGVRRNHAEGKEPISLNDLTVYDYETFVNDVFALDKPKDEKQQIPLLNESYPIEVLIPINDDIAFAVYRLRDGTEDVYVYMEIFYVRDEYADEKIPTRWAYNMFCYYVTERLTYADMASLQVGDTVQELIELCPAVSYLLDYNRNLCIGVYTVFLEEGFLIAYIDDAALDRLGEIKRDSGNLSEWAQTTQISDMIFIPYGNTLTEEEKTALVEWNPKYESKLKYSTIPYMLLPE
jgi:hypothetical protein